MPFSSKRTFSESLSPPSQPSSSDDEAPVDPPLKRRFLSPTSQQQQPQVFANNSALDPSAYAAYQTSHSSGVGAKRSAPDLDDDDVFADDGSSTEGESSASTAATFDGRHHVPHQHRPPPGKRMRRGLSDHLRRMGLNPSDEPVVEEHNPSQPFVFGQPQQPWQFAGGFQPQPEVEASSVTEPPEVGPAVWLGHAPGSDEVRFEELSDGEGSEQEDEKTRAWRMEVFRGQRDAARGRDRQQFHLPSYMSSSGAPFAYNLPPPDEAFTNRERGLVLYNPSRPAAPQPPTPSSTSSMDLDTPTSSSPYPYPPSSYPGSAPPVPPPAGAPYAQPGDGWFSDASRFEELPDDELPAPGSVEGEGGMDID